MISKYRIHFLVTVLIPAESHKAITISLYDLFIFLYVFFSEWDLCFSFKKWKLILWAGQVPSSFKTYTTCEKGLDARYLNFNPKQTSA